MIIDNVRSAYNIGSFFRTADAAGSTMLHLCGISPYPPNPKLDKTALGALNTVAWKHYPTTIEAIDALTAENTPIVSVEKTATSLDYRTFSYSLPIALVLGHELHGVSDFALDRSSAVIHIPMRGTKTSLNVATAAGIILFEALRSIP